jgi:hypothetical protein
LLTLKQLTNKTQKTFKNATNKVNKFKGDLGCILSDKQVQSKLEDVMGLFKFRHGDFCQPMT